MHMNGVKHKTRVRNQERMQRQEQRMQEQIRGRGRGRGFRDGRGGRGAFRDNFHDNFMAEPFMRDEFPADFRGGFRGGRGGRGEVISNAWIRVKKTNAKQVSKNIVDRNGTNCWMLNTQAPRCIQISLSRIMMIQF